jgi:hypothetical protein
MSNMSLYIPIVGAAITAAASLLALAINAWLTAYRERANRRREMFSKAFAAAVAYEEFPYVVRRRRTSAPEDERIRISTELRKVQEDISYYSAWLFTESQAISEAYETLIRKLREIAGKEIHNAWNQRPAGSDAEMNMPDLGLSALKPFKQAYLREVADHLSPIPRWLRRPFRWISRHRWPLLYLPHGFMF